MMSASGLCGLLINGTPLRGVDALKIRIHADFELRSFAYGKTPAKTEGFCMETPPSMAARHGAQ